MRQSRSHVRMNNFLLLFFLLRFTFKAQISKMKNRC